MSLLISRIFTLSILIASIPVLAENVDPDANGSHWVWSENLGWLSFSCTNTSSCGSMNFALQFDPDGLIPTIIEGIFKDSFEAGP